MRSQQQQEQLDRLRRYQAARRAAKAEGATPWHQRRIAHREVNA